MPKLEYIAETELRARARRALQEAKRSNLSFTQESLGERLGVAQATISKALNDKTEQPYSNLLARIIAECEQVSYNGPFFRFGGSDIVIRGSRAGNSDESDIYVFDYRFSIRERRGEGLRDIEIPYVGIRVIMEHALVSILKERGRTIEEITKHAYFVAQNWLTKLLEEKSIGENGHILVPLSSDHAQWLLEQDPLRITYQPLHLDREDLENMRFLQLTATDWSILSRYGVPMTQG